MSKDNLACFWQARSCRHHHCVSKRDCDHNGLDCTDIARSYQPSPHSPSNRERLERGQGSTKSWDQWHNSHQRQPVINTQHSANGVQSQLKTISCSFKGKRSNRCKPAHRRKGFSSGARNHILRRTTQWVCSAYLIKSLTPLVLAANSEIGTRLSSQRRHLIES